MSTAVTAAVLRDGHEPLAVETLTLDEPRADEVLVRIVATGICQTDAHVRHGMIPSPRPIVLGHEGAGIVERVGGSVTSVVPGDHVIMSYQSCGACAPCTGGHPAYCDLMVPLNFGGARIDGSSALADAHGEAVHSHYFGQSSFASHALASERNIVKVPKDLPLELLAPLGCGVQTGAGAILEALAVPPGASLAVFGVGAVGLSAIMAAKAAGAETIIAIDLNPERLALARELGATHSINGGAGGVAEAILGIVPRGVDYGLDTSGHPASLTAGAAALASLGTFGFVAYGPGNPAAVEASHFFMGKTLRGVVQGGVVSREFIPKLIELYRAGRFPFDRLIRFYDFDAIETAFADAAAGIAIKPVIRMAQ